ncbi:MAG: hypothetical protein ACK4N5_11205 [Myxococcales bacterium]
MQKRDYLIRQVEQLVAFVRRLMRLLTGGNPQELEQELQSASSEVGLDLGLVRALPTEELLRLLAAGGQLDHARCWYLAELLYVDAVRAARGGDPLARGLGLKALRLFLVAYPKALSPLGQADSASKIDALVGLVGEPLPEPLAGELAAFRAARAQG